MSLNESIVEDAALDWFGELGYAVGQGPPLRQANRRRSAVRMAMWCWRVACARRSP